MEDVSKICGLYPFKYILNKYGYNFSEESLMVRLQLFGFQFGYIHDGRMTEEQVSRDDDISIIGLLPYSEENMNHLAKVRFYSRYFNSKELTISELRRSLKNCSPIIIFSDVYELSYHPLYRTNHGQNVIMVHNYDQRNKTFEIEDNHVPTMPLSCYRGWIAEQGLTDSLLIVNFTQSQNTGLILHEYKEHWGSNEYPELKECIKKNFLLFKEEGRCNRGLAGLKRFEVEFRGIFIKYHVDEIMPMMKSLYLHLTGRAGMVISRKCFGSLLEEEAGIENNYSRLSKLWQEFAGTIFRISIGYKEIHVEKAIHKLHNLVEAEWREVDTCIKKLI